MGSRAYIALLSCGAAARERKTARGRKAFEPYCGALWSVRQKVMDLVMKKQGIQQLKQQKLKEARTDPRNRQWFILSINILLSK